MACDECEKKELVLTKIVSGGQTGADRGGWDAAIELRIKYGGWIPGGAKAEDGRVPAIYLANGPLYDGIWETLSDGYRERTELNALIADGTVIFTCGPIMTGSGSKLTLDKCERHGRLFLHVDLATFVDSTSRNNHPNAIDKASRIVYAFLVDKQIRTLNVAGSRESKAPGIQAKVKAVLLSACF